jgi:hypothetical protein
MSEQTEDQQAGVTQRELDFVWINKSAGSAIRVKRLSGEYWALWLHPDKWWVTATKLRDASELQGMCRMAIDPKYMKLYEFGVEFSENGWPVASEVDSYVL